MESTSQEAEDSKLTEQSDICFIPPLYEQRYQEIVRIARECQPKKVVDIGCGELKVIRLLKFHKYIHELLGLDVDEDLLKRHSYVINPLAADYLNPLPHPLVITLLNGSITQRDSRLLNCDLAVCVEVIEHLFPDSVVEATKVIFGYMKPMRAVFTTPNSEFNVLFPGLQGFRHDDHKFEWTRREFQEWGNQACSEYGYSVQYTGLGTGPEGSEHLGFCTQVAIFDRILPATDSPVELTNEDQDQDQMPYTEIARAVYPSKQLGDEDIAAEAEARIRELIKDAGRMLDDEDGIFDNASEDDDGDDDSLIGRWIKQSLAVRIREIGGRDDRDRTMGTGGRGSELSADRQYSSNSTTVVGDGSSDCIMMAAEQPTEALQSSSVCHSKVVLNYATDSYGCRTKNNNMHSSSHSCQTTQDTDLPKINRLNLRDYENKTCPGNSVETCQSISKPKVQSVDRIDAESAFENVLDFGECAYALRNQSQKFSSQDVEDGATFYDQWEKGFPRRPFAYDLEELNISISLERLMSCRRMSELCPDMNKLRETLLASGKFNFSSDGAAIITKLYEDSSDSELWEATSDDDWDSDAQSQDDVGEGLSVNDADVGIDEAECWD